MTAPYTKPWLSLTDQLQRLKAAGLIISDETKAANFLRHLNYYRFSGYGLAFEATRHQFQRGTTFEQIRAAYEFDRTLRDLTYESMEVVELDIRTSVAYTFGQKYGAFGHTDKAHFYKGFDHKQWYNSLKKAKPSDPANASSGTSRALTPSILTFRSGSSPRLCPLAPYPV